MQLEHYIARALQATLSSITLNVSPLRQDFAKLVCPLVACPAFKSSPRLAVRFRKIQPRGFETAEQKLPCRRGMSSLVDADLPKSVVKRLVKAALDRLDTNGSDGKSLQLNKVCPA